MNTHNEKLTVQGRIKAAEAGMYQRSNGEFIAVSKMLDMHLINAWLRALSAREPLVITRMLATEVARRGLVYRAEAEARDRTACPRCGGVVELVEDSEVGSPDGEIAAVPFVACSACDYCAVVDDQSTIADKESES